MSPGRRDFGPDSLRGWGLPDSLGLTFPTWETKPAYREVLFALVLCAQGQGSKPPGDLPEFAGTRERQKQTGFSERFLRWEKKSPRPRFHILLISRVCFITKSLAPKLSENIKK